MQQPWNNEQVDEWRRSVQRVGGGRILFWFFAINLPLALVMSALSGWHNSVVGTPTPVHLLVRFIVALLSFAVGGVLFLYKLRSLARKHR